MLEDLAKKIPPRKHIEIICYGIVSGTPFAVLYTALVVWLKEEGHALAVVTTIAASRLPYSFKFVWSPLVDSIKIPYLYKLGRRRSWMIVSIILMTLVMCTLGFTDAKNDFNIIYTLALILGFAAATFDIAFDAFRIDSFESHEQGIAVANAILGFRIGAAFVSSVGLYLSTLVRWEGVFCIIAIIFAVSVTYVPFLKEPNYQDIKTQNFVERIKISAIAPFTEFLTRKNALLILLGVVLYKVGDVLLGFISTPFYLELGYTKTQVAAIAKFFGLIATLVGTYIGGAIIKKVGNISGLIICGILMSIVNLSYIWLHYMPIESIYLFITICIENIGCATGSVALAAYLSSLCNKNYSATQYALFTSFAAFANSTISIKAGSLVDFIGWDYFFFSTVVISIPSLLIFWYIEKCNKKNNI